MLMQGQLNVQSLSLGDSGNFAKPASQILTISAHFRCFFESYNLPSELIIPSPGNYSCLPSYTTPDMVVIHITTGFPRWSKLSLSKLMTFHNF